MEEKNLKTFKEYFLYIVIIVLGMFSKITMSEKDQVYREWLADKEKSTEFMMKSMDNDSKWKYEMLYLTNNIISQNPKAFNKDGKDIDNNGRTTNIR